jgi:O-antigen/teichoic acid export membrane protein
MLRSVGNIMRGTLPAQILGIAVLPILTRHFDPAAFGHYQLFQSALLMLLFVASLRLELLILRVTNEALEPLLRTCVTLNLLVAATVSAAFALVLYARPETGAELPFSPLWVALGLTASGIVQAQNYLLTREQRFVMLGNLKLAQSVVYVVVALAIALTTRSIDGLIMADVAGRIASLFMLWVVHARQGTAKFVMPASLPTAFALLWHHRALPATSLPGVIMNAGGSALMPVMFFATFGPASAGQLGLVERACGLPLSMILMAVTQVFSSQIADKYRSRDASIRDTYLRTATTAAKIAALPALLAAFVLPLAFTFVFGARWAMAGQIAQIMVPAYFFIFVGGTVNQTLMATGHNRSQTGWEALWLCLLGAVWLIVPALALGPLATVALNAGAISLAHCFFLLIGYRAVGGLARVFAAVSTKTGNN